MTDAQINTSKTGDGGKGFDIETQTPFANESAQIWDALGKVAPVDRAASSDFVRRPVAGRANTCSTR